MLKFLPFFLLAFLLSAPAGAVDVTVHPTIISGCYTHDEAVAEQGLRIHSELMVIGLNCQQMTPPGQENLYQSYREFTARNAAIFAGYENTLINYFRRTGAANPEGKLNTLRTQLANAISLDAARSRPDVFCTRYIPRISHAATMTPQEIRKWAATFYPGHPTTHPLCTGQ